MSNQKISVGDKFPVFTLKDENDRPVNIADYIGKPLVVYFYPKDDTPGCTREACYFRDQFEFFTDEGATVMGISSDGPASHKKFKAKYNLPFILLSDRGNRIRHLLGVPSGLLGIFPGRVTYIIDREGIVSHLFNSQLFAKQHVDEAIESIKAMQPS